MLSIFITAAIISFVVAVVLILINLTINKLFRLDIGGMFKLPKSYLIKDVLFISLVLFVFQVLLFLVNLNSVIYIFIVVVVVVSYPSIIQPYRLIKVGSYRNCELEKWLFVTVKIKCAVLISPKKFSNALAFGLLPMSKVIIISKDLYDNLTECQLKAIILHEAAHIKHRDLFILNAFSILFAFIQALLLSFLLANNYANQHTVLYFTYIGICGVALYFIPAPLYRYMELKADCFASNIVGSEMYVEMLVELDKITLQGLSKSDFYHPSLDKRIRNVCK